MMFLEVQTPALDFTKLTEAISSQINPTMVLTVMGAVVSATVGIFLVTWGGKKIIYGIQKALKKGSISA